MSLATIKAVLPKQYGILLACRRHAHRLFADHNLDVIALPLIPCIPARRPSAGLFLCLLHVQPKFKKAPQNHLVAVRQGGERRWQDVVPVKRPVHELRVRVRRYFFLMSFTSWVTFCR